MSLRNHLARGFYRIGMRLDTAPSFTVTARRFEHLYVDRDIPTGAFSDGCQCGGACPCSSGAGGPSKQSHHRTSTHLP